MDGHQVPSTGYTKETLYIQIYTWYTKQPFFRYWMFVETTIFRQIFLVHHPTETTVDKNGCSEFQVCLIPQPRRLESLSIWDEMITI